MNKVHGLRARMMATGRWMKGRQVLHMVYEDFKVSRSIGHVVDWTDLQACRVCNDDLVKFFVQWDEILFQMDDPPNEGILKNTFLKRIGSSPELERYFSVINMKPFDHEDRQYPGLRRMVEQCIAQRNEESIRRAWTKTGATAAASPPRTSRGQPLRRRSARGGQQPGASSQATPRYCFTFFNTGRCSQKNCPYPHVKKVSGDPARAPFCSD